MHTHIYTSMETKWFSLFGFVLLSSMAVFATAGSVTYDGRSLVIDGQHRILFSGSIHYPRSTPEMWPSLISKAKEGGIDVIQTYVFWNLHEPKQGQYDFSGGNDIVRFIKEVQAQGLYVCLRIGPFIESEWSYGGLPFWLHDIPGIVYRTDNEPFKAQMQRFTEKIVNTMKAERLYASQGGPIILSQIENEYNLVEGAFHEKGQSYVRWAAKMAVSLQNGVPWIMCKQDDAPDPVINTCNGMRCGEMFSGPNSPTKPAMWTENWTSFYQVYGEEPYMRSAQDIAFHVALFIAKKGSYVNYYMYHGGTNFGRSASAYTITGYYDQAPLDEYGLTRQPKWGHLKELHAAIKLCSKTLLSGALTILPLGKFQQAYVYEDSESGQCAAFLMNNASGVAAIRFRNFPFQLPGNSISILPDCKIVAFNSAKVSAQYDTRSFVPHEKLDAGARWEEFREAIPTFDSTSLRSNKLLEHPSTTKDQSDYLWYTMRLMHGSPSAKATLSVQSSGHVVQAFVNGNFVGSKHGSHNSGSFTLESQITLNNGINYISLLSEMVGLPDSGAFLESRAFGITKVLVDGKDQSRSSWGYQVGLSGENSRIYSSGGYGRVKWSKFGADQQKPLTWYMIEFDASRGSDPLALNLASMGKGQAWVNGQSIGRYWVSFHTSKGQPSQTWYHVPRSFLKPTGNSLTLLEEESGVNPLGVSLDRVIKMTACAKAAENDAARTRGYVKLSCPAGKTIWKIVFASFGTPSGGCESYALGSCHASQSEAVVKQSCLGKRKCSVSASRGVFGDPCPRVLKTLLVDAVCK